MVPDPFVISHLYPKTDRKKFVRRFVNHNPDIFFFPSLPFNPNFDKTNYVLKARGFFKKIDIFPK